MKKEQNIDELFSSKLQNLVKEPPEHILANILTATAANRRKKTIVFWRMAGVAAALLIAFVAGWQFDFLNSNTQKEVIAEKHISVTPHQENYEKDKVQQTLKNGAHKSQKLQANKNTKSDFIQHTPTKQSTSINQRNEEESIRLIASRGCSINNGIKTNDRLKEKWNDSRSQTTDELIDKQIIEQNKLILAANQSKSKAKWSLGAQVSPGYNVLNSDQSSEYANNMLSASDKTSSNMGGGVSVEFKPAKRWSFQSGVYYGGISNTSSNLMASATSKDKPAIGSEITGGNTSETPVMIVNDQIRINSAAGVIDMSNIPSGLIFSGNLENGQVSSALISSDASFTQNFQYIEVPFFVRYVILDSRFDVEMLGGFSSNILVGNDTFLNGSSGKTYVGVTRDMETLNYSGTMGIGLKYGLTKHISLNVEPRVKYYLNSLSNNSSVTYKPYSIGFFTGISYQF
jgi:hypothetical protein